MLLDQFKKEVGRLLYVVADLDEAISSAEKLALLDMVIKELDNEKNPAGNRTVYKDFEPGDIRAHKPYEAIEAFIYFIEQNENRLEAGMLRAVCKLVPRLADAYYQKNRKEKHLLHALNLKLCML
jgi:hypothetical protein